LPAEDPSTGFALDTSTNEAILALFDNSPYIVNTLEKDPSTREEEALIEVFKKQRPGEPPTLDNARNLLRTLFFDPKRYDLTKVGRYKLNQRLGVNVPEDTRVLTTEDIVSLVRKLLELPVKIGIPEDSKDFAAEGISLSRAPIVNDLDEYEHFGNRRLRTVGELIQEAFRVGLYRMERLVRDRLGVRLRPDPVPEGRGRQGQRRHRLPRRRRGVALRDRTGERAARQERQVRHGDGPLPLLGGRGRDGGGEGRRPDGRLA